MLIKIGLTLAVIVIVLTFYKKFTKNENEDDKKAPSKDANEPVEMKQDPICGSFTEVTTKHKVKYYDDIYYFCSDECKQKFIKNKQAENA